MRNFKISLFESLVVVLSIFSCVAHAADTSPAQNATNDTGEIRKLFANYAQLMNEKDTDAIAQNIYAIPVLMHQPNGDHVAYTDQASFSTIWKRYIEGIEAKQGAVKLEITDISPCLLNQNTAIVTTTSVRTVLKDNSTALSGWAYVLNRKNGVWKISEISARDLNKPLKCQ